MILCCVSALGFAQDPDAALNLVERELARGGMGIVHAARDPGIRRDIVVKSLHPDRPGYGQTLRPHILVVNTD